MATTRVAETYVPAAAINDWDRLSIAARTTPGIYQPAGQKVRQGA
jgi:hypothetical protein